jgi:uncharacterized membrane protein
MKWLSAAVLAGAAVVLALLWDRLPAFWAVHWGLGDRPDGWASKSILGVFGPLLFGALLLALIDGLSRLGAKRSPAVARAVRSLIGPVELGLAIVFATLALWLPLGQPRSSVPIVLFTLSMVGASIVLGSVRLGQALRELKTQGVPGLEGWHGAYYSNPNDPRLWVPKLLGLGWTLNFAHRGAWPVLLLLLSPVLVVGLVIVAAAMR